MRERNGDRPEEQADYSPAERVRAYRWQPGQSGNPGGRPRTASITAELRRLLDTKDPETRKPLREQIAETLLRKALAGDARIMALVLDRADGPVRQEVTVHEEQTLKILRGVDDLALKDGEAEKPAGAEDVL